MKKLFFVIIPVLFFLLVTVFISVKPKKVFFPRENEIKIYDETKINKMIDKLEKQLKDTPENVNVMVELGIYYFVKGPQFYDRAINLFYDAWQLGGTDVRIFYYLGCMYEFLKLYVLAQQEYKKFLTNIPKDVEVLIRMGNVLYKLNKSKEAKEYYMKALSIDKNNIVALTNLGYIFFEEKDTNTAIEYFSRVQELAKKKNLVTPKNINFYLGKIFFENKNYETAKKYFLNEQQNYPDNVENSVMLVKTYYYLNEYKEAYELSKQLIEIIPENKELVSLYYKIKNRLQKA